MKAVSAFAAVAAVSAGLVASHAAAQLVIYPAKNQSAEQQSKDESECQTWAKGNTGVDPVAVANSAAQPAPVAAAPPAQGQRVRGAARGAAAGAAIGAVAGDAGKGAAIGATTGAVAGGVRKRRQADAANQQAQAQGQQQTADRQAQMATFNKAYTACLEGRGYSVK
ncbi:MAG TPA: glycine zipper family protein [Myxococcota bacterium]|nr:glycine zipper family protein [Myxococcota bacterium]